MDLLKLVSHVELIRKPLPLDFLLIIWCSLNIKFATSLPKALHREKIKLRSSKCLQKVTHENLTQYFVLYIE